MGNDHHLLRSSFSYSQHDVVKEEKSLTKILPPDDSDDYELAEAGCEIIMVEDQMCSIPYELYDLLDLKGILSLEAWNCHLTEDERFSLAAFLPDMDQQMFWLTVKELLTGGDLFFGSPLDKFYTGLKGGLYSPHITCFRNNLRYLQKNEYYHSLRSYHENMTRTFDEMKQVWDGYRPNAMTVEERIHVWNTRRNYKPKFVVDLNAFPDEDILNKGDGSVETQPPLSKKAKYANQGDSSAILLNGLVCNTNRKAKGVLKLKPVMADVGRSQVMQALPGKSEQPSQRIPKGVLKIKHKYDPLNQVKPGGKLEQVSSDIWGVHADAPTVSPPQFAWKKDELNVCDKLPIFCQINRDGSTYRSPVVMQDSQREWHDLKKNWNTGATHQSMPTKESSAVCKRECFQPALENYQEQRLNALISAADSRIPSNCNDKPELFTNPLEHSDYRIKDDAGSVAISGVEKCLMFPITYKRKKPYRKLNQVDTLTQQQEVAVNLETAAAPSGMAKLKPMAIKIKFRGWKGRNG